MGGTKAERRLPLWLGTASAHKRQEDCNPSDAKSAYAAFITTNAARRRGGITAAEAGTIFRDAFQQAGEDKRGSNQTRSRKRRTTEPTDEEGIRPGEGERARKRRRGPLQAPPELR